MARRKDEGGRMKEDRKKAHAGSRGMDPAPADFARSTAPPRPRFWDPVWDSTSEDQPWGFSVQEQGQRYLLPCVRLYYGGIYEYLITDVPTARRWVMDGPMQSYLSHPFVAKAFERIIGFFCTPPAQKGPLPAVNYNDDVLIFSIDTYETLPDLRRGDSKAIDQLVEKEHFTLALLKRLS